MANTIKIRRSAVGNAVPTTGQLALGELAVNTFDGRLFLKKDDGFTTSIVEIGYVKFLGNLTDTFIDEPANNQVLTYNSGLGKWVNQTPTGGTGQKYTYSSGAPSSPVAGDEWLDSDVGILYTYVNDGNSSAWVELGAPGIASATASTVALSVIDIDGGTDIGAALADADLFIVDDGGSGTNRKAAATRITDYTFGKVSGDITITSAGVATIAANAVVTADIAANAVTYAKIQNLSAGDRLLGRFDTGAGVVQEIVISAGLTGTGGALTIAASGITTAMVQNDAITYAKIQNMTSGRLLGRTTASAGDVEEISTGVGLSLASGTLTAIPREKSITIESPTATEKIAIFYTTAAITVSSIRSVIIGTTSVTFSIRYGTDLSGTGTEVVTGGTVANTSTSVQNTTTFNSASIPADRLVWITTSALSGTPTQLHVTVVF